MRWKRKERKERPVPKLFAETTSNDIGKQGERNLIRVTGARPTPGSGNKSTKGDAILENRFMMEKKSTAGKTMTVKKEWFEKLSSEAFVARKEPVFVLEFEVMSQGSSQWAAIPLQRLLELYEIEEAFKLLDQDGGI